MDTAIFSYCLSSEPIKYRSMPIRYCFGKYHLSIDSRTPYSVSQNQNGECAIFGYAVNVITAKCDSIPDEILTNCNSIDEVIEYEKNLGGKYIIFYNNKEEYYILGDATASVPLFYYSIGSVFCSNNPQLIAERFDLSPNPQYLKIRHSSDISQAMPFDITVYKEIKQLLPNHYYDVNKAKSVRFVNSAGKQREMEVEEATDKVLPMIDVLARYYLNNFKINCPITSGRDSRVVLAFLLANGFDGSCCTIKHPEHTDKTQDIVVPGKLCSAAGVPHSIIKDVELTPSDLERMDDLLGKGNYSTRTLRIAQTVKDHCANSAIINGDIIGQVGKCSLHRDIPACFATPGYFRCKLHNYSHEAKQQLKLWIDEIKQSGEKINTFDLFSIENRMGRWAAQENLIYNSIGQIYLNVFNSRSIIYIWTAVSRNERKNSCIHIDLIKKKMPELLGIPFERDESLLVRLSKANGLTYLLSSYAKYYIESVKFKRGN